MIGLLSGIVLFVLAQLAIALSNRRAVQPSATAAAPGPQPLVSILVPARNEQASIAACVQSLLAQEYPRFELLVLDDQSSDRTPAILHGLAAGDRRMRVIRGAPLPPGWLGKNWACAQLADQARGELLLFTDADTRHQPGALRNAVAALFGRQADLLALWPLLQADGLGEQLIVPLIPWSVFSILSLPLAERLSTPVLSAGIGQFLLFRREAYREVGGHAAVRSHAAEDLALVRQIKRAGLRWRLMDGQSWVTTRMYRSMRQAWDGLRKNLYPAFGYRALPLLLAWGWLNLTAWLPLAVLARPALGPARELEPQAVVLAAVGVGAALLLWGLVLRWFGFSAWQAVLYPIRIAVGLVLAADSVWSTRTGRARWKGRRLFPRLQSPAEPR